MGAWASIFFKPIVPVTGDSQQKASLARTGRQETMEGIELRGLERSVLC